jgi:LAO/AO transport system ATPase/methylmalonyl-CoA epimerase
VSDFAPLVEGIVRADQAAVARGLTVVENGGAGAAALMEALRPLPRRGPVVGITGPMGVGKSTLIGALLDEAQRRGVKAGVLAVDPTSHRTGGALLGDRLRMGSSGFIRSMAHRGGEGGVSDALPRAVALMTRAFPLVLVETLGAGQDEVAVEGLVDRVAVLVSHATGDSIQILKGGLMEIADLIVATRGDEAGAAAMAAAVRDTATLLPKRPGVLTFSPGDPAGAAAIFEALASAPVRREAPSIPSVERWRLSHIAVAVADGAAAGEAWSRILGPASVTNLPVPEQQVEVTFFHDRSGVEIELLHDPAGSGPVGKFVAKKGPGLHHLCFSVEGFDEAIGELRAAGITPLGEPKRGAKGRRVTFFHPGLFGGVLVELEEG